MATIDESSLPGKIRDKPIARELRTVLIGAADAAGIDTVFVTSGGQPGSTGRRTGSTRHDGGRAADLQLIKQGRTLTFTDRAAGPDIEAFVTAAAARGATGIGAGVGYMGNKTLHVGFGTSPQDRSKLVWGAGGRSANAPAWLKRAAQKGWEDPTPDEAETAAVADALVGRHLVIARGGLHLRKGPGLAFGVTSTLATGTSLFVLAFDGGNRDWAKVDLEGDGFIDGHVFAAFLRPDDRDFPTEDADEPDDGEA
jgi:hypothetical protein